MRHLIIIGVGGFAREIYWSAQQSIGYGKDWDIKGFLDGDTKLEDNEYKKLNLSVLGNINTYDIQKDDVFTCAIGTSSIRKNIVECMIKRGVNFIPIIHNTAIIQGNVKIGKGIILCQNTQINDNACLGDFVIVNSKSGIGHDAYVGNFVSIMSFVDITGNVFIDDEVYLGSGSRVLPHGKVGFKSTVGAGSVVLRNVKPNTTVFGVPAVQI